jgi:hypothetical protein
VPGALHRNGRSDFCVLNFNSNHIPLNSRSRFSARVIRSSRSDAFGSAQGVQKTGNNGSRVGEFIRG